MFSDLTKYSWVLAPLTYPSKDVLIKVFKKAVVDEAFEMHKKIQKAKADRMQMRRIEEYLQ